MRWAFAAIALEAQRALRAATRRGIVLLRDGFRLLP